MALERGGNEVLFQIFIRDFAQIILGTKKGPGTKRSDLNRNITQFSIERRTLVKLVNKHKAIIQKKFPGINMKDVVDFVEMSFKNSLQKNFNQANVKGKVDWVDAKRNVVEGTNFRTISDLTTHVRKDIREQALRTINTSTSKLERRQQIAASIVIGGLDIRQDNKGGDIGPQHIEVDREKGIFKLAEKSGQALSVIAKKKKQGFDVGHTFGPGIGNLVHFVGQKGEEGTQITTFLTVDEKNKLIAIRDQLIRIDASIAIRTRLLKASGRKAGTITITIAEFSEDNQTSGARTRQLIAEATKILNVVSRDLVKRYTASPTILSQYALAFEEIFVTGKTKQGGINKVFKSSARKKQKIKVYGPGLSADKDTPRSREARVASPNIQQLIDLINDRLHDQIRENMGKGGSAQKLNYRTGRFARSAKVQSLFDTKEKNALGAQVKYMRNPYGVFEKGGRLHKQLRDPKGIFGRSIRQILQQEQIATLRRVKVKLSG